MEIKVWILPISKIVNLSFRRPLKGVKGGLKGGKGGKFMVFSDNGIRTFLKFIHFQNHQNYTI